MTQYSIPIRVYIEDTDAGGVVYYANYLRFMERARTEWLRASGVELDIWQHQHRKLFVVRSVQVDFLSPAKFNDQLTVCANLVTLKSASLICNQPIMRGDKLLIEASVKLACIDADTMRPCAIPTEIKEAVTREF